MPNFHELDYDAIYKRLTKLSSDERNMDFFLEYTNQPHELIAILESLGCIRVNSLKFYEIDFDIL